MTAITDLKEILVKGYDALKWYERYDAEEIDGLPLTDGQKSQIRTQIANWITRIKVLAARLPDLE